MPRARAPGRSRHGCAAGMAGRWLRVCGSWPWKAWTATGTRAIASSGARAKADAGAMCLSVRRPQGGGQRTPPRSANALAPLSSCQSAMGVFRDCPRQQGLFAPTKAHNAASANPGWLRSAMVAAAPLAPEAHRGNAAAHAVCPKNPSQTRDRGRIGHRTGARNTLVGALLAPGWGPLRHKRVGDAAVRRYGGDERSRLHRH
jgi:hypothetical protein